MTTGKIESKTDYPNPLDLVIERKLMLGPDTIIGKRSKVLVLEVPIPVITQASAMSDFFGGGELPIKIDGEARVALVSGLNGTSMKLTVFSVLDDGKSLTQSWRTDLGPDQEVAYISGFDKPKKKPFSPDFDKTLEHLINNSHPIDKEIMEYAEELEEIAEKANWSKDDIREIQNALMMAELHHKGQRRQSGELYITHPWETMKSLIAAGLINEPDILKAALVHDVPEDSEKMKQPEIDSKTGRAQKSYSEWYQETWDILSVTIGPVAATYAMLLSRPRPDGIIFTNEEEANLRYRMNLVSFPEVLVIKMADRLHNIRTLSSMPPENQENTIRSTVKNYLPIFELARERYPEAVDYLMFELEKALRSNAERLGIDYNLI